MSRFVECNERILINADHITFVERGRKTNDDCTVHLDDGSIFVFPNYVSDYISGKNCIRQLVPCEGKFKIAFSDVDGENNGKPWLRDFEYFAICEDCEIRPLDHTGEYFEFTDEVSNYIGFIKVGE